MELKININVESALAAGVAGTAVGAVSWSLIQATAVNAIIGEIGCKFASNSSGCYASAYAPFVATTFLGIVLTAGAVVKTYQFCSKMFRAQAA